MDYAIREGNYEKLGVQKKDDAVIFTFEGEKEENCSILFYGKKAEPVCKILVPEEYCRGSVRSVAVTGKLWKNLRYNYEINGKIITDTYATRIIGREKWNDKTRSEKDYFICGGAYPQAFDWENDRQPEIKRQQMVMYKLHVRGFSMEDTSCPRKERGTFRAITDKIPYLKKLGITTIELMPAYEFEEQVIPKKTVLPDYLKWESHGEDLIKPESVQPVEKINYWGYVPGNYFAPKASYSSSADAASEFRELVHTLHENGMECVMEFYFAPGMNQNVILDALRFWVREYHVDGFVLNPYNVPWEQLIEDPLLKDIKLMQKDDGFQNVMRRFLKGDENMVNDVIWALNNRSSENGKCNYITTQTGFTLWDLVSYDCKHNEENGEKNLDGPDYNYSWNCGAEGPSRKRTVVNLRKNQVKNALELLLTAQGTPCLLAGDEFCNSQRGNNNAYCQDNETGWVNWTQLKKDDWLFQYIKKLIGLRKEHRCLHQSTALSGMDTTRCGIPDVSYHGENAWQVKAEVSSRQLGVLYSGTKEGELPCFTAYNMHWLPHHFAIPTIGKNVEWYLVMTTKDGVLCEAKKLENQKEVLLEERSVAILVGRRIEEKKSRSEKKPIYTVKTQNVNKIEKRQEAEELCKEEQPAREGKV